MSTYPKKLRNIDKLRRIDPANPDPKLIEEAARIIRRGGIVSFPTRCLYGLGADAFHAEAVNRIFKIKQRPSEKPILVLIPDQEDLTRLVTSVPPAAVILMKYFWPGRLTLVFEAKDSLSTQLTAGTGKIGIRLPEHRVAVALVNSVRGPITATSANLSGDMGAFMIPDLNSSLADELDLILDAGPLKGGPGSTVIDVTTEPPHILRVGEISPDEIALTLDRHFEDH